MIITYKMFEEFVGTVALERSLTREAVLAVADGRVMAGRQALDAKLVDHIGDRHDALARAKELGKIAPEATADVVEGPEKPASFLRELIGAVFDVAAERQAEASHPVFMY